MEPTTASGTIAISLVRGLVDYLHRIGVDRTKFLDRANLTPECLENPGERISLKEYDQIQEQAIDMSADDALGLHMGAHASIAVFDVLGYLTMHARTLRDVVSIVRFAPLLVSERLHLELQEHEGRTCFVYDFPRASARCNRMRAEFGLVMIARIVHQYVGEHRWPLVAMFEHPAPSYATVYTEFFDTVHFGQPQTALAGDAELLDVPQAHPNPQLSAVLGELATRMLDDAQDPDDIESIVHRWILENYRGTRPTMKIIAPALGISPRSLRRRFAEQHKSFSATVDTALGAIAQTLLAREGFSIQQAADAMGFSESSAFHRAFKRWTAMTPGAFCLVSSADRQR